MISEEQMKRAEIEFELAAAGAYNLAHRAERVREQANYARPYSIKDAEEAHAAYQDADYLAESRAWILSLIRHERTRLSREV